MLVINDIVKADAGIYACHLTNPFGSDSQNVKVVVRGKPDTFTKNFLKRNGNESCRYCQPIFYFAEPPDEPRNLKVLEAGSTSARVSWDRPSSHNPGTMDSEDHLPINSFTIEWTPLQSKERLHYKSASIGLDYCHFVQSDLVILALIYLYRSSLKHQKALFV